MEISISEAIIGCTSTQTYTLGGIKYFIAELSSLYIAGFRYFFERPPKW